jgi:RNA polymerase sigma-70 factor (ECF subfamily)
MWSTRITPQPASGMGALFNDPRVKFGPLNWGMVLKRHSSMTVVELIRACAQTNDGEAWEEFVVRFQRPISLSIKYTACQWGKDQLQFVDDLLQETYLKLCADKCRRLLEFAEQHPDEDAVLRYIKTIAINIAHDHFKSLHSLRRGGGNTDQLLEDFEPVAQSSSHGGPDAMERQVLLKQIDRLLQNCAAGAHQDRDCLIFRFYYLQGISAKAIAALAIIKLTAKGVESVIFRLTRCVQEHLGGPVTQNSAEP